MIGKIIGAGVGMMLGMPGLMVGLAIGHYIDSQRTRDNEDFIRQAQQAGLHIGGTLDQVAFTVGVVILGAKMAKADGYVTRNEIDTFKRVFNIPPQQEAQIAKLFDQARHDVNGYEPCAAQLARVFRQRPAVLEELLTGLMLIAAADGGGIGQNEELFLRDVARIFGFGAYEFRLIAARSGAYSKARSAGGQRQRHQTTGEAAQPENDDPYTILGVTPTTPTAEIKAAYRKLMMTHHPDKLVAAGMAPEFVAVATEKIKRINAAYEIICQKHNIK